MRAALILVTALLLAPLARAQESVVTGISTESIALTANYDGSEIFVFGAVRRDAPIPEDMPPLGIIITLKGPERLVTVRRKDRRVGVWLNTETVRIRDAPSFYAIASTGPIDGLLSETEQLRHQIGMDQAVRPEEGNSEVASTDSFTAAVVRLRKERGLYTEDDAGVSLAEETLFQARFFMPANLVEGDYAAEFFLVRDRTVISSGETTVRVYKAGIERWLFNLSRHEPFLYGLLAVALALVAGWTANAAFRLARR